VVVDKQLEEQLERMRRLTEQLTAIQRGVSRNNELITHRTAGHGPLSSVTDCRTHQSPDYDDFYPESCADAERPDDTAEVVRRRRRR
jgi:hypothetical protein